MNFHCDAAVCGAEIKLASLVKKGPLITMWMVIVIIVAIASLVIWPDCEQRINVWRLTQKIEKSSFILAKDGQVFIDADQLNASIHSVRGTEGGGLATQSIITIVKRKGIEDNVRLVAILALRRLGADAKGALPELEDLLSDPFFKAAAASAIEGIESDLQKNASGSRSHHDAD